MRLRHLFALVDFGEFFCRGVKMGGERGVSINLQRSSPWNARSEVYAWQEVVSTSRKAIDDSDDAPLQRWASASKWAHSIEDRLEPLSFE